MSAPELPNDEILSAYLDGELGPEQRAAFEQRLANEPDLSAELAEIKKLSGLFQSLPERKLRADFAQRVLVGAEREMLIGGDRPAHRTFEKRPRWQWLVPLALAAALAGVLLIPDWGGPINVAETASDELDVVEESVSDALAPTEEMDAALGESSERGAELSTVAAPEMLDEARPLEPAAAPKSEATGRMAEDDRGVLARPEGIAAQTRAPSSMRALMSDITAEAMAPQPPQAQFNVQLPANDFKQQTVIQNQIAQNAITRSANPGSNQQIVVVGNRRDVAALMRAFQEQGATVEYEPLPQQRALRQQAMAKNSNERRKLGRARAIARNNTLSEEQLDSMYGQLMSRLQVYAYNGLPESSTNPLDESSSNALLRDVMQLEDSRQLKDTLRSEPAVAELDQDAFKPAFDAEAPQTSDDEQLSLLLSFEPLPEEDSP